VAVDASCWLHTGAYSCAYELAKGIPTRQYCKFAIYWPRYVEYCVKRISQIIQAGVTPVLVFDGGRLPMKQNVEKARAKSRSKNKEEAEKLVLEGNHDLAFKKFAEGITITAPMVYELIKVCKEKKIEFFVAPYEADAQMTYLYKEGYVAAIITEDSDLLAFGCDRVLFKLDNEGYGYEINMKNLENATELNFANFSKDMFLKMCILGGCDYLPSIKGIGLKTAYKIVKETTDIPEIVRIIKRDPKYPITQTYQEDFTRAFLTFKFHTVYDFNNKTLTPLNKMQGTPYIEISNFTDKSFLGPYPLYYQ